MLSVDTITQILKALGCSDAGHAGGQWVTARCPLAFWTHKTGKDSNPSFGVNVQSGSFNCFSCLSGTLEALVGTLELYEKQKPSGKARDYQQARDLIAGLELDPPLPEYGAASEADKVFYEWSEFWLESFIRSVDSTDARKYLHGRLVTDEEQIKYDLRWDSERKMIVCPFRNVWGKLAGARGRSTKDWGLAHYDYKFNGQDNSKLVLYNEHVIPAAVAAHKPVVLVEGQFDAVAVARVYPYVVANMTAKPTPEKAATLSNCPDGVLLMLDNDDTGKAATPLWANAIHGVPVGRIDFPAQYKDASRTPLLVLQKVFEDVLSI